MSSPDVSATPLVNPSSDPTASDNDRIVENWKESEYESSKTTLAPSSAPSLCRQVAASAPIKPPSPLGTCSIASSSPHSPLAGEKCAVSPAGQAASLDSR
eukprot:CAMPEP_0196726038 /NCGR_PEP_ID=MMETSP1091-20130531/7423_1 /TAXON_ID=302021 /ORGANISM="Rhodomonas sp., Strain CCMP768" /LENGTH=99 /DNA_ID=CAMNT_0042068407 /DNA_START=121 /DNA_END=420 /DNA_ORIENTATION=+